MRYKIEQVKEFLRESNAIEGVFGDEALEDALKAWQYIERKSRLTVRDVNEIHLILMRRQPIEEKYKGHFRDVDVYVGGRKGSPPPLLNMLVGDWCTRASEWQKPRDPKTMHVLYEKIHPHIDGNGRTGRILLNWMRLRQKKPLLIIKDAEKKSYYTWFHD